MTNLITNTIIGHRVGDTQEITLETIIATCEEMRFSNSQTAKIIEAIEQAEQEQREAGET